MTTRGSLTVAAASLLACVWYAGATLSAPGWLAADSQRWPAHFTLLVRATDPPGGDETGALRNAAARLASRWAVVSRFTAFETINAFATMERVRVADLPARLDDMDPRFDPYLRSLPALFSAVSSAADAATQGGRPQRARYEVMYVRSDHPPLAVLIAARYLLRGSGVIVSVAELRLSDTLMSLVLLILAVVVARVVMGVSWPLLSLAALPYLAVVLASGVGAAALAAALYPFAFWLGPALASSLVDPSHAPSGRPAARRGAMTAVALVAAIGFLTLVDTTVMLACSIHLAIVVIVAGARILRGRRAYVPLVTPRSRATIHASLAVAARGGTSDLGVPAPIATTIAGLQVQATRLWLRTTGLLARIATPRPREVAAVLLAAALLAVLPRIAARPDVDATFVAAPPVGARQATVATRQAITSLNQLRPQDEGIALLPTLSALVSHAAYQAALPYGFEYGLPEPGEELTLPRFSLAADGEVQSWQQALRTFDDRWLQELLMRREEGSVLSLLAPIGGEVPVLSPAGVSVASTSLTRLLGTVAVLVLLIAATLTRLSRCVRTPGRPRQAVGGQDHGRLLPYSTAIE